MKLKEIAHSRTGDKGNSVNISVIPFNEKDFEFIGGVLTEEKVKDFFKDICKGKVTRYTLKGVKAYNFVLERALNKGVSVNPSVDKHGKSFGFALLEITL